MQGGFPYPVLSGVPRGLSAVESYALLPYVAMSDPKYGAVKDGTFDTSVGAGGTDNSAALQSALTDAISRGVDLIVDGPYKLGRVGAHQAVATGLTKSIRILGSGDAEFIRGNAVVNEDNQCIIRLTPASAAAIHCEVNGITVYDNALFNPLQVPSIPRISDTKQWVSGEVIVAGTFRYNDSNKLYRALTAGTCTNAPTGTGISAGAMSSITGADTIQWRYVGAWSASTTYIVGDLVTNDGGNYYYCYTAGTTAASGGPTGIDSIQWGSASRVNTGTDTITSTDGSDNVTAHKWVTGQGPFRLTGVLPAPLVAGTDYWFIKVGANTFQVADSYAHALSSTAIDLTTQGTSATALMRWAGAATTPDNTAFWQFSNSFSLQHSSAFDMVSNGTLGWKSITYRRNKIYDPIADSWAGRGGSTNTIGDILWDDCKSYRRTRTRSDTQCSASFDSYTVNACELGAAETEPNATAATSAGIVKIAHSQMDELALQYPTYITPCHLIAVDVRKRCNVQGHNVSSKGLSVSLMRSMRLSNGGSGLENKHVYEDFSIDIQAGFTDVDSSYALWQGGGATQVKNLLISNPRFRDTGNAAKCLGFLDNANQATTGGLWQVKGGSMDCGTNMARAISFYNGGHEYSGITFSGAIAGTGTLNAYIEQQNPSGSATDNDVVIKNNRSLATGTGKYIAASSSSMSNATHWHMSGNLPYDGTGFALSITTYARLAAPRGASDKLYLHELDEFVSDAVPSATVGGFAKGQRVWATEPNSLGYMGWECLTAAAGAFTWKPFGPIPFTGSTTWNPGNLILAATELKTITVTGAALGDISSVSFGLDTQGMLLTSYVSAANTVTAQLYNPNAGAVNLASDTVRATVYKKEAFGLT